MSAPKPSRGEVWTVDLDPVRGHEQGGVRPALVVSVDAFNHSPADLVIIVPLTTRARPLRSRIPVDPPEGGVVQRSFIMCEMVRSIAHDRLGRRWGAVSTPTFAQVEDCLRILLGL